MSSVHAAASSLSHVSGTASDVGGRSRIVTHVEVAHALPSRTGQHEELGQLVGMQFVPDALANGGDAVARGLDDELALGRRARRALPSGRRRSSAHRRSHRPPAAPRRARGRWPRRRSPTGTVVRTRTTSGNAVDMRSTRCAAWAATTIQCFGACTRGQTAVVCCSRVADREDHERSAAASIAAAARADETARALVILSFAAIVFVDALVGDRGLRGACIRARQVPRSPD